MPDSPEIHHLAIPTIDQALHELLDEKSVRTPTDLAFRFLVDGQDIEQLLTYGELAIRAKTIAAGLIRNEATGQPVLLIHPPGLGFIEGLFACFYAGAIAVPAYPPRGGRHRRRFESISSNCGAKFALAPSSQLPISGVEILNSDAFLESESPMEGNISQSDLPCLLQYTSGSTADPKGVMISHRNFRSHFSSLECYRELDLQSAVSWLPPYHDMGLVLKILYAFEAGIPLTFFSPDHFIQRPVRWLRAISRYRAELSGAPNFAFEMCLRSIRDEELQGIDLSCWKAAPCGAERIRPETLERFAKRFSAHGFRPEAFLPGYGLAETTLIVTACPAHAEPLVLDHPTAGKVVSCGLPLLDNTIRIVDQTSGEDCKEGEIGEILVKGPILSNGYWKLKAATHIAFGPETDRELRTGDLGFLESGHLYVTGRIKDLIIIDGANHAPEDLESLAYSSASEITAVAAFSWDFTGREMIVIALETDDVPKERQSEICQEVRYLIGDKLEVSIYRVLIVRRGLLPRTTSGKIRRAACREELVEDRLKLLFDDIAQENSLTASSDLVDLVLNAVKEVTGRDQVLAEDDLIGFGVSSIETTRLAALLESRSGIAIPLGELFATRSFLHIAALLTSGKPGGSTLPEIVAGSGLHAHVLTHSQERMWFLHQLEPASAAYHVFGAIELKGSLEPTDLESAVRSVISNHAILCSRHGTENGAARVWINETDLPSLEYRSLIHESAVQAYLARFARRPFVLADESAVRMCLVLCGPERHVFSICMHHIVADGWSVRILVKEIAAAYQAIRENREIPVPPARPSYLDYALVHRRWIESGAVDEQVSYWKNQLAGHSGLLHLPTDFPRPAKPTSDGRSVERTLAPELINQISMLARVHRCTPFMVHLTAFLVFLHRHGGGDDPVVAIPVANRNHAAAGEIIGTLVNTLPFRLILDPNESFSNLLDRVRTATFEMQAAQDAPFEKIIEAVKPDRSKNHSPIAQVMFDHQEIPIAETWDGNLECRPYIAHRGAVQFDLSLLITVLTDRQQLSIEYRTDLFLPTTAASFSDRYLHTLALACEAPERILESFTCLTHADLEWQRKVSQGPVRSNFQKQTTLDLISNRAKMHPDYPAVTAGDHQTDYKTLERRADQLASALHAQGVRVGDRVAILLDRDADLAISLLAIWKAGAAYIPLDSTNPPERLKLILDDQAPIHVLTSENTVKGLPLHTSFILIDHCWKAKQSQFTPHQPAPTDTAYIIYTSGSTGKPKGVVVSHGALANFLLSMAESPGFHKQDRLLAVTTVSFDISTLELFLPLICGGNVILATTAVARDGNALRDLIDRNQPTVMQATPATWRMLIDAGWQGSPTLKILCGGETLDLPLATQLARLGGEVWNLYGPTETTVWSTLWRVPADPDSIRIGSPIANTGIHILSTDGAPVPPGGTGELWIYGSGLADGYWKRPELTDSCFVTPSFGAKRYRTGDLARWSVDGNLECLGRSDGQVKIRGFRVELGEIEAVLTSHPQVTQAKVALRGTDGSNQRLVAWITISRGESQFDTRMIREFIAGRLPTYMIPADIGVIDSFPLGSSGKVDVSSLANPDSTPQTVRSMTESEDKLAKIWQDLLEVSALHPEDNWFEIGGHSLLVLKLFSRIHTDFKRSLPISAILEHSTLEGLAALIDQTPPSSA